MYLFVTLLSNSKEDNNIAVVHQLESTIREKTDKLAEQNKYITDLQTSLEQVRNQSHLYMDMLEKTRTEYSKYKGAYVPLQIHRTKI